MPSPKDPNKYLGPNVFTGTVVVRNRQPTLADYRQPETGKNYEIGCIWQVGSEPTTGVFGQLYMLQKIVANQGFWILLSTGVLPVGPVVTLSDTVGTVVMPTVDGNIQLEGSPSITVTADPLNNKLIFALAGGGGTPVSSFTTNIAGPVVADGSGVINIIGGIHSSGTQVPIETDGTVANRIVISSQITTATLASSVEDNGIAHFDAGVFSVNTDGWVGLLGGSFPVPQKFNVDSFTGPGTDPVVASGLGVINITGSQVASGIVGANVIRTDSLAPNTITVEVQRAGSSVAPDSTLNGVAHFNSADFTVDADGYVSSIGGSGSLTSLSSFIPLGSAISVGSGANTTVTSLALTTGTWLVNLQGQANYSGGSSIGNTVLALSTTTNSLGSSSLGNDMANQFGSFVLAYDYTMNITGIIVTPLVNTTYFMVMQLNFGGGVGSVYGRMSAVKIA